MVVFFIFAGEAVLSASLFWFCQIISERKQARERALRNSIIVTRIRPDMPL